MIEKDKQKSIMVWAKENDIAQRVDKWLLSREESIGKTEIFLQDIEINEDDDYMIFRIFWRLNNPSAKKQHETYFERKKRGKLGFFRRFFKPGDNFFYNSLEGNPRKTHGGEVMLSGLSAWFDQEKNDYVLRYQTPTGNGRIGSLPIFIIKTEDIFFDHIKIYYDFSKDLRSKANWDEILKRLIRKYDWQVAYYDNDFWQLESGYLKYDV